MGKVSKEYIVFLHLECKSEEISPGNKLHNLDME